MWLDVRQDRTDRVVLEAYADHWNTERGPRLERVTFLNDLDPAEALEKVCDTEGEVDIVTEVDPHQAARVEDSTHADLVGKDAMRVLVCLINRDAEGVPLHDPQVRKALNLAVDRQQVIDEIFAGYARPLRGLTPDFASGAADVEPYAHDPEQARRLLDESGWPQGRPLRLAALAKDEAIADLLASQLRDALGIEVDITIIPEEETLAAQHRLVEKALPLPFDLLVHAWFDLSSDAPPAALHRDFYAKTGAFRTGPPIPAFDEQFADYLVEMNPDRLNERAADLDRFAHEEALSVFICQPQALYAVNRHVRFVAHAATFELAETEVTEEHWSRR